MQICIIICISFYLRSNAFNPEAAVPGNDLDFLPIRFHSWCKKTLGELSFSVNLSEQQKITADNRQ